MSAIYTKKGSETDEAPLPLHSCLCIRTTTCLCSRSWILVLVLLQASSPRRQDVVELFYPREQRRFFWGPKCLQMYTAHCLTKKKIFICNYLSVTLTVMEFSYLFNYAIPLYVICYSPGLLLSASGRNGVEDRDPCPEPG